MTLEYSRRYWDPGFLHVGFLWRLHASFLQCSTVIRSAGACSSTVLTPKTLSCPTTLPQFLGRHPQHPKSVPLQSFLLHTHIVICPPTQIHTRIAGSTVSLVFSTHLRLFRITTSYQVSPRFASKAEHGSIQHLTLCVDDGCSMSVFTFALTFLCVNHRRTYPPNPPRRPPPLTRPPTLRRQALLRPHLHFSACFTVPYQQTQPRERSGHGYDFAVPTEHLVRYYSVQHAFRIYPPGINFAALYPYSSSTVFVFVLAHLHVHTRERMHVRM
ncbi:hypothetical protein Hypma_014423 [Hypsizygus marmoreus]|uniref:Uncharacterized protein n=1 Tax=Hypsizygus marmoreus TaxID=39966 RepID=A0A369JJE0_HYPMA|nr:hypothetical protein Hypma_014423 [Hypsizygus marmoreus]